MTRHGGTAAHDLLGQVLSGKVPAYALLHRPAVDPEVVDVLTGDLSTPEKLADLPRRTGARHEVLALIPYRQVAERGYACVDDGEPLIALSITDQAVVSLSDVMRRLPDVPIDVVGGHFDVDDDEYAQTVRRVVADEIGTGQGANFVIKRSYVAEITDYSPDKALTLFRRLVRGESGAHWTFLVHTGDRTFVGATPERHVTIDAGTAVMNPISGTYRYPSAGPALSGVMDFLADVKESDELYMVLDEELKMMGRICDGGGRVVGPRLREMARVAHTEYFIEGHTTRDPREVLHETLFAPTVTGSPLESACRVISRYEPAGRGYYSGVIALIGRDERGGDALDSAILIRTADIDRAGTVRIGVGATLVRHSDPEAEADETRAKAAGLLTALRRSGFAEHPRVRAALEERNDTIARFWLGEEGSGRRPRLEGRMLVVDQEDTFTSMLAHQLRALGLHVSVRRFDEPHDTTGFDLVLMGPGPGDPRDTAHPKIAQLRRTVEELLENRKPFLAVCLSHQVLSARLGLPLIRRDVPNQGLQREIDLFGTRERVGFYNTFAARSREDVLHVDGIGRVEVCRDPSTHEVHALRGPHFASLQFHAESVLTRNGPRIIGDLLAGVTTGLSTV